ncbi:hypothetical protein [Desulfobacula toluolica]|uniref:Conserved uncharacterized protein n=1 Tax=Desulfobacula toluolica (strain DSM 7467 / Tol2) TaxID=651182 RepID=K0NGH7_DESTT|nr:hypothetical protein [Desulfobacula toluolica]CCK78933.1 conserved uncharacterized protein [Desulfobacula toluolica Tol2]
MKGHATIPWSSNDEWSQVFIFIKKIDKLYGGKLEIVSDMAIKIQQKFEKISESIDMVCSQTCVQCKDICCLRATIWYDLKDLLYIYFARKTFPESQISKKMQKNKRKSCCWFSEKGCTLSRLDRPFVCTWYFCPVQKKYLARYHHELKQTFDQALMEIKILRNKIEEDFIRLSIS